jgi:hypothetical protein
MRPRSGSYRAKTADASQLLYSIWLNASSYMSCPICSAISSSWLKPASACICLVLNHSGRFTWSPAVLPKCTDASGSSIITHVVTAFHSIQAEKAACFPPKLPLLFGPRSLVLDFQRPQVQLAGRQTLATRIIWIWQQ